MVNGESDRRSTVVLSVIVPTYNERDSLPALVARLAEVARRVAMEVVIVDDASPDGTGALAETLAQESAVPITVVHRTGKAGLATAVIAGVEHARGAVLTVMDADLSHPPEILPDLLHAIAAGADIAVASRYTAGGGVERWPLLRRIVSRGATWVARTVLGLSVRDPLSGCLAARREVLTESRYLGMGYKLLLEILVRNQSRRVVEVPYRFVDRQRGRSKLDLREMWAFIVLLARLRVGKVKQWS